jgi:hypothetical protein
MHGIPTGSDRGMAPRAQAPAPSLAHQAPAPSPGERPGTGPKTEPGSPPKRAKNPGRRSLPERRRSSPARNEDETVETIVDSPVQGRKYNLLGVRESQVGGGCCASRSCNLEPANARAKGGEQGRWRGLDATGRVRRGVQLGDGRRGSRSRTSPPEGRSHVTARPPEFTRSNLDLLVTHQINQRLRKKNFLSVSIQILVGIVQKGANQQLKR